MRNQNVTITMGFSYFLSQLFPRRFMFHIVLLLHFPLTDICTCIALKYSFLMYNSLTLAFFSYLTDILCMYLCTFMTRQNKRYIQRAGILKPQHKHSNNPFSVFSICLHLSTYRHHPFAAFQRQRHNKSMRYRYTLTIFICTCV